MDIAKAFDTVPHKRLRFKLQWYSVVGNTYQWISSFLSDHHQKVVIDNVSSDSVSVVCLVSLREQFWAPYYICTTLRGRIKWKSRDTTEIYP